MRVRTTAIVLGIAVLMTGCYHATVDTGMAPSGVTIDQPWAPGFLYGLIGPSTVQTAGQCPAGVARVDTRMSFLNQIATGLTFGLFSPMHITVQCAAGSAMAPDAGDMVVASSASADDVHEALVVALTRSLERSAPVYVQVPALSE